MGHGPDEAATHYGHGAPIARTARVRGADLGRFPADADHLGRAGQFVAGAAQCARLRHPSDQG